MSLGPPTHGEQETAFDWAWVVAALVLAGLHAYLGVVNDAPPFFVVAGLFVLGVLIFFTGYWRAMVYLLAAVYVVTLGVIWVLGGMPYRPFGLVTSAVSVAFVGLGLYLYFRESEAF